MAGLLTGRVAIVTGGGKGLGKVLCLALAEEGADIVVAGRTPEPLETVAGAVRALGRKSLAVPTDVTSEEQVVNLVNVTLEQLGRVDILINNAATITRFEPIVQTSLETWNHALAANLTSAMLCSRECIKPMSANGKGAIINMVGTSGKRAVPYMAPHSASKFGLVGLTQAMALETAAMGIRINAVCPGGIEGEQRDEIYRLMAARMGEADAAKSLASRSTTTHTGQTVTPQEISKLVVFLVSDLSEPITGQSQIISRGGDMY